LGLFLILIFAANAVLFINYRVVDKNTMFLPAFLVWALWLGLGYQALLSRLSETVQTASDSPWLEYLVRGVMVSAVILALAWNWSRVDLSDDTSTRERGEAILQVAKPDALILGWWDTVPVLEYLQQVEGQRPDVLAVNRFLISGQDMEELINRELGHRPIYINTPPVHLLSTLNAVPAGPVYELQPRLLQKEVRIR
jgi:hypothetical protein